ncbi:MAG: ChaN family lipoprotein [Ramlibacter sp.]|nr:ChaN family lipoprotein [Ramlibacter sp.]
MRSLVTAGLAIWLASCASFSAGPDIVGRVDGLLPVDAVLLGEQHDATSHQRMHRRVIEALARRGVLAAVVVEMAEQGHTTAGLPRDAGEAAVRTALQWDDRAWPWAAYGPAVMAAVRAGVPVLGGNLPRSRMREAMADTTLDRQLPGPALKAQQQAIRLGHCGALPESQIGPMTRVQVGRDQAMARTVAGALQPGQTVLLLAGAGHVAPDLGVPRHLPAALRVAPVVLPPVATGKDYCRDFRRSS